MSSTLAEHTRNLQADPRCSLLVTEPGDGNPLARGRVTLQGQARRVDGPGLASARESYLAVHAAASFYVDFKDFAFWRLHVEAVRYIGGFGRMSWVAPEAWHTAVPDPMAASAAGIIEHMNDDHADALVLYCRALSRAVDTTEARMTGIDRYGFEMSATTEQGPRPIRVAFDQPIATARDARTRLVELVARARALL